MLHVLHATTCVDYTMHSSHRAAVATVEDVRCSGHDDLALQCTAALRVFGDRMRALCKSCDCNARHIIWHRSECHVP
jgi:hypothetical protein